VFDRGFSISLKLIYLFSSLKLYLVRKLPELVKLDSLRLMPFIKHLEEGVIIDSIDLVN
jgi:hypothetical protein